MRKRSFVIALVSAIACAGLYNYTVIFSITSFSVTIPLGITLLLTLLGAAELFAGARQVSRARRYVTAVIPILILLAAPKIANVVRLRLIETDEGRTTGSLADVAHASRLPGYSVRADFIVNGVTYQTGWQQYGGLSPGLIGSPIRIRYRRSDPRIAVIETPGY